MKNHVKHLLIALALWSTLNLQFSTAHAQGTAFTYQGQLQNNGSLASGTFNLTFSLFNVNSGGTAVAGPVTNNAVIITNGLFTVLIDFGAGVFTGATNWLEIGVETNGGGSFTTLAPRQELSPVPYAIYAESVPAAGISGTLTNSQLAHSAVTVNPGPGFSGGGKVSLGNTITLTNTGVLSVTGNADITAATVGGAVTLGDTATSTDTASTLVKRDGTGSFSAASIALNGNLNLPATTATAGIIYSGGLTLIHAYGFNNFFAGPEAGNLTMSGTYNTANGAYALFSNTGGYDNTANGYAALANNTNGYENTANGASALGYNTSGDDNTAVGSSALHYNTSGYDNTAVGGSALYSNTNGSDNTAIGNSALAFNTTGDDNTANGVGALQYNTSGSGNAAVGWQALDSNTSADDNTAMGYDALFSSTTGTENTAIGSQALDSITNGSYNTAIGYNALELLNSGNYNIALGYQAGQSVIAGTNDIEIGNYGGSSDNNVIRIGSGQTTAYIAGVIYGNGGGLTGLNVSAAQLTGTVVNSQLANSSITINAGTGLSGGGAVALGGSTTLNNAGVTSLIGGGGVTVSASSGSVTLGSTATSADTGNAIVSRDGSGNFSAGSITLAGTLNLPATTATAGIIYSGGTPLIHAYGSQNFFSGPNAGNLTMSGPDNTASGYEALYNNTLGSANTAVGAGALLSNTNGSNNTAVGAGALNLNTSGGGNTANGQVALYNNTSGSDNTANGWAALYYNTSGSDNTANGVQALNFNTIGTNNTANGYQALYSNTNGVDNTAIGDGALFLNTRGYGNTANGFQALYSNTSGGNNTAIGWQALYANTSGVYNLAVGSYAGTAITTGNLNIDIFDAGSAGDNGVIRIGTPGNQTQTYIAGIYGATAASGVAVYVNSSGQLGTLTSSRRFKDDIRGMDQASAVLYALKPVTFKYKPGIDPQGIPQFGLVAEDVEKVAPDLVAHDDQGKIYTVRYQAVDAMLLNEFLKEHKMVEKQIVEIEDLKQQNDSLAERLNELEATVKQLAANK